MASALRIRRTLRPGDLDAVVAHHGRLYAREHGLDSMFEEDVAAAVGEAAARGFPNEREAYELDLRQPGRAPGGSRSGSRE